MKAPIEEINAFVDRNKEEMLLFWEQLVNRQAGSKEVDRVNRIMHFLKERFEQEGIDCRLVDSKGSADVLVAELNADVPGAPLLLSGHCDTVFPSGSYPEDPFHIEDGFARGPGVLDMKCGVAQIFYLSFLPITAIPDLAITDGGCVDYTKLRYFDPILEVKEN